MSMKKYGFTLGEVLITLSVVSLVAILTIPTFLGDLAAKGRMARLTSTIGDLDNAVHLYMIKNRLNTLDGNFKFNDFLEIKGDIPDRYEEAAVNNKTLTGVDNSSGYPEKYGDAVGLLSNGVFLGQGRNTSSESFPNLTPDEDFITFYIDVNGEDKPNTVGLDIFEVFVYKKNFHLNGDPNEAIVIHAGDIGGYPTQQIGETEPYSEDDLKDKCLEGNTVACYTLAEQKGFAYDYYK